MPSKGVWASRNRRDERSSLAAMTTPDLRPLSVGEIVDAAIKVYRRNALTMFKLVAVVVIPVQILSILIGLSTTPEASVVQPPVTPGGPPQIDFGELAPAIAGALTSGLLAFVATALATGACFKAVADAYLGGAPDARESFGFARARLGSILWVSFLGAILTALLFLLLVVPGIYVTVAWTVAVPVLLFEGVRGAGALGRSRRLVKGRWWPVAGALLLGLLVAAVVSIVIGAVLGGVLALGAGQSQAAGTIVGGIVNIVGSIIATPFQAALVSIIYFDLRVRKEGLDVALLTQRMSGGSSSQEAGTSWPEGRPSGGSGPSPFDRPAGG